MKRLFVDMDGTLARFHDEALYLERMFEEGFFKNLKPFENMVSGIKEFMRMHPDVDVYIVSSAIDSPYCVQDKNQWLDFYLPEISEGKRLFPEMGTSKADYIKHKTGMSITLDDFLLDDYNQGLIQFQEAGGKTIKCHNNINHKGLGLYGGEKGKLWSGEIAHTEDLPFMVAAELSMHMKLDFDFKPLFKEYGLEDKNLISVEKGGQPVYTWDNEKFFTNPLDAIRFNSERHSADYKQMFRPVLVTDDKDFRIIPRFKLDAMKLNFLSDNNKGRSSVGDANILDDFKNYVIKNCNHPEFTEATIQSYVKARLEDKLKAANERRQEPERTGYRGPVR